MNSKCNVYDENATVSIIRDTQKMQVPFCELQTGDRVIGVEGPCFIVGEPAHKSEDPVYEGWLVYSDTNDDYYPEDFGAKCVFKLNLEGELELNREWIYDDPDDDPVAERNFVIPEKYFNEIFPELFPDEDDIEEFLDIYEPETDGEKIYQRAKKDGKIIDEFVSKIDVD